VTGVVEGWAVDGQWTMVFRRGIKFVVDKTTTMAAPGNRRQALTSRNRRLEGCITRIEIR